MSLSITTASLPGASDGNAYSQTLAASGGTTPYTWSITAGALPAWASLNASTGAITGTPSAGGTASFTVTVTDAVNATASKAFTLTTTLTPYVISSNGQASGGSTVLPLSVATQTPSGDTILVAALSKTAGVTPSVSDIAGNTYNLILSDTTESGAQLFVFEAPQASPIPVGSGTTEGTPGPTGSTVNTSPFPGGTSQDTAMADWNSVTGTTLGIMKAYFKNSSFPTIGQTSVQGIAAVQGCIDKGIPAILCYKPQYNPPLASETTAMVASIQSFLNAGLSTNSIVVLWQEVEHSGMTAAQYHTLMSTNRSALQGTGLKTYYDASGSHGTEWSSYYPGKANIDGVAVDFYADTYSSGARIDSLMALADNDNLPFGLFELGVCANAKSGAPSQKNFEAYLAYLQALMTGRLAANKVNGPVVWFNGGPSSPGSGALNVIVPLSYSGVSYANKIAQNGLTGGAGWPAFVTAITTVSTQSPPISVTYSANTTNQAAIAIGVSGTPVRDKAIIAHGSSAAPSSGTSGTLSQAVEQAVGFIVAQGTGSNPAWTAPFSHLANTSAYISAAADVVNTNAALTASATMTSAPWTAALVTYATPGPAITLQLSDGIVGEPYSQTLEATGATPPYTWSVSGGLPTGLSLTSGVISGTPTAPGTFTFIVSATDSNGAVSTQAQAVTIGAGGSSGAPAYALPTNILSVLNSNFETAGDTWSLRQNSLSPVRSSQVALAGSYSLYWQSASDGSTSVQSAEFNVTPNTPYIASAYMLPCAAHNVQIGLKWIDSTDTAIRTDFGTAVPGEPLMWTPVQGTFTSPSNAVTARVIASVDGSNAGDVNHVDLAFVTQSAVQVLVDWTNPAFDMGSAAGKNFMDVSPWVRMDLGGTITRGRQDAISEVQPASSSFTLQNDSGLFTRFGGSSFIGAIGGDITIQLRCQVNLADENGGWWTRFDGPISEIDYTLDVTGNTNQAFINATDVLAPANRQSTMFCWTKEQVLSGNPVYHWSLDDSGTTGGAGLAVESSGNNGPPMRLSNSDSTAVATIAWGDTSAGVETLADAAKPGAPDGSAYWTAGAVLPSTPLRGLVSGTTGPFTTPIGSVLFTPVQTAQTAQNTFIGNTGYMLETELSTPITPTAVGSDYCFETWFMMDSSIATNLGANYGPYVVFGLGSSRTYTNMVTGLFLNAGALKIECATYNQPPAFKGKNWAGVPAPTATASTSGTITADKVKVPHHLMVTIQGDPTAATVTLWLDGNSIGTFALPTGQTYDTVTVGGAYGGCGAFYGNISLLSIYNYIPPQSQITTNCQMGQYGNWELTSDDTIYLLGSYSGIPGFWFNLAAQHGGLSLTEYLDITGTNAIANMQLFEQAEHGLLFTDARGNLNFHTRDWRMGYGAPDLYLPPNTFDPDLQMKITDQFLCNEMAVSGPNTLGATATTTVANGSTGQTSTQTSISTLVSGAYINVASQKKYGVYTNNPVSSPISLPLYTWSRGSMQLGVPSFAYWPDPNLSDLAAWTANSFADPWLLPAQVLIDLLTLDPNTGLEISDFYGLEIDNMVSPSGPLPDSFPGAQVGGTVTDANAIEWFIEGITEVWSQQARTIQFYTSPADSQRAWVPGDPVYGVLGSTTRIGISAPDTNTPQADGKDVSHDSGPPYWPPAFAPNMNNPDGLGSGFVGANDMRGIAYNLQQLLTPPMAVVTASSETQSVTNGSLSAPDLFWDVVHVDTGGSVGLLGGWPNWHVVTTPGWYEIDWCVTWSLTGSGLGGYTGQAWIVVAQQAAQAIATGAGNPRTVNQYVYPVGEAVRFNSSSMTPVCSGTTRMYLGLGDMVAIAAEQNYTSARGTSTAGTGSAMALRFTGIGTVDDRTEINSSIANGGTVSLMPHGGLQVATFTNTATYSYQGKKGFNPGGRRNTNGNCYQGLKGTLDAEGSQVSQIAFNASTIQSALTGHTVLGATLQATNVITWYSTGSKMMLGTTTSTPGALTFQPTSSNSAIDIVDQKFQQNQNLTFSIPVKIITNFVTGSAKALILGDGSTDNLDFYGAWNGGAGQWTLTVSYA